MDPSLLLSALSIFAPVWLRVSFCPSLSPSLPSRGWAHSVSDGLGLLSQAAFPSPGTGSVGQGAQPQLSEEHHTQPALNKQSQCCLPHLPFNLSMLNSWLAQWEDMGWWQLLQLLLQTVCRLRRVLLHGLTLDLCSFGLFPQEGNLYRV